MPVISRDDIKDACTWLYDEELCKTCIERMDEAECDLEKQECEHPDRDLLEKCKEIWLVFKAVEWGFKQAEKEPSDKETEEAVKQIIEGVGEG